MKVALLPSGPLRVNTYIAVDEATNKAFMVDPGGYDTEMIKYIGENHMELEYIILTHGHEDHIAGVNEYKEMFPEVKVVAHEAEFPMIENAVPEMVRTGFPICFTPDIAIKDGDTLMCGDIELKFFHTPGHTLGGMCIYVEADRDLYSGDTLFQQSIGRTDFPGGSFKQITESIKRLYQLPDDTRVMPGHMGLTTIAHEKENNPFVRP
ncbi:MAG: MBL fold metallo-hydrolase [Firmicutes bacterium]|nr:MBL fold metallo-hydrolase [Bacillota bacterium]